MSSIKTKKKIQLNTFILIVAMLLAIFPVALMVYGAFKSNVDLSNIPPSLTFEGLSLKNYEYIIKKGALRSFSNSCIISVCTTIIVVVIDTMAGYVFARKNFPGKKIAFVALMCTMLVPKQILMVPTFILLTKLGLYDSILGTVLSSAALPFGVFLIKQSMQTLPEEVFEASRIDGCSEFHVFTKIALPLAKTAIFALSIFVFVQIWNDYLWQLVTLTSKVNLTMPLFLKNLVAEKSSMIAYQFAGAVLSTIPILSIFIAFSKYFVSGATEGSVKG